MKHVKGLEHGMGIGGWLTNYKRFNVLPEHRRMDITVGDMEHFESYITESDIAYIATLGMDHVRLGFDQIVVEEAPFVYRARIIELLHSFVGWCRKYSLRPVLNMHKAIGNYCDIREERTLLDSPELQERFVALWCMLEDEFAGENDVVFELLNEVRDVDPASWNTLAATAIKALRKKNPDRLIIIGSTCWNSPERLCDLQIFDDENIIYTFHFYAPHEFTHQQGVLQADQLYYNRKMPYPTDDADRYRDAQRTIWGNFEKYAGLDKIDIDCLRADMIGAKQFADAHPDLALWCGEFGTIRHCNITYRENWMRDVITILKEWDIPYCVWNYLSTPNDGNRFSLVDDDTRIILSDELARIIKGE